MGGANRLSRVSEGEESNPSMPSLVPAQAAQGGYQGGRSQVAATLPSGLLREPEQEPASASGYPRNRGDDSVLLTDATERRIDVADLDGRFLGAPPVVNDKGGSHSSNPDRGHGADLNTSMSSFWIVRTEQVTSCVAPRPKQRSQRRSK